jgi:hypothetical protein
MEPVTPRRMCLSVKIAMLINYMIRIEKKRRCNEMVREEKMMDGPMAEWEIVKLRR